MSHPEHYHSMTDEQLAEWAQLSARVHKLTSELVEAQSAAALAEEKHKAYMRHAGAELPKRGDMIVDLAQKHVDQMSAARRSAAALVLTLKALEKLCNAAATVDCCGACVGNPEDFESALREAREVIASYGIPF